MEKVTIVAELRYPITEERKNEAEKQFERYLTQRIIPWFIACEKGVEVKIERFK